MHNHDLKSNLLTLYRYTVVAIIIWTIIVVGSLSWNVFNERQQTREMARKEARANFNKDIAFRLWGSSHGGVYVPPDKRTPPNPYLSNIPDRDIITEEGKKLTLMNPAYMLRQMMEFYGELYGVKGRITSIKPLNPVNKPDEWEHKALKAFERNVKEVFEFTDSEGESYLRLMRPFITEKPCLKCHEHQGYKEGDIRGGVGITVPMKSYLAAEDKAIKTMLFTHGLIWILGLIAVGFMTYRGKQRIIERKQAERALRDSEEKFKKISAAAQDAIVIMNNDGIISYWNEAAENIFGYVSQEILGKELHQCIVPRHYYNAFLKGLHCF